MGIGLALAAATLNGYNDSGNIVATMISSGAMPARRALLLAAAAEFVGPFVFGSAVAGTVGRGVVDPRVVGTHDVLVVLLAVNLWAAGAWYLRLPSSSSHVLIGALAGAVVASGGPGGLRPAGIGLVVLGLLAAPPLGLAVAYGLMKLTLFLAEGATPGINLHLKRAQIVASLALGVAHGTNNVQVWLGAMTLLLVVSGRLAAFAVPLWVTLACATCFSLGTAAGGWRVMRTLGLRMYRIRPVHGFASQVSAAAIILAASLVGGPVSTTHVAGSAIMGAGAGERLSKVRWGLARVIVMAWIVTLPGAALTAVLLHALLVWLLGAF